MTATYERLCRECRHLGLHLRLWDFVGQESGGWILTVQRRGVSEDHTDVDVASRVFDDVGELDMIATEVFAAMRITLGRQQP